MELTGRPIGFKAATFYLRVVDNIARDVEGLSDPEEPQSKPAPVQKDSKGIPDASPESPLAEDW